VNGEYNYWYGMVWYGMVGWGNSLGDFVALFPKINNNDYFGRPPETAQIGLVLCTWYDYCTLYCSSSLVAEYANPLSSPEDK